MKPIFKDISKIRCRDATSQGSSNLLFPWGSNPQLIGITF